MNKLYPDANEKHCLDCNKIIKSKAEICPHCGCRQMFPPKWNGKNRLAAVLFAFFLGGFGVHKFYLGSIWLGILYLIFSWTFIPSIIALIEGILYLVMSDDDFQRKYSD